MTIRINEICLKIFEELGNTELDLNDYPKRAAKVQFIIGYEYYSSAWLTIMNWQLLGGAALLRVELENLADMLHVAKNPKRAKAYIEIGMKTYVKGIKATDGELITNVIENKLLRHVNRWSKSTIEDRIIAAGKVPALMYDFYSYFGHPNPGNMVFLNGKNKGHRKKATEMVLHDHLSIALSMIHLAIVQCELKTVSVGEIEKLAAEFKGTIIK